MHIKTYTAPQCPTYRHVALLNAGPAMELLSTPKFGSNPCCVVGSRHSTTILVGDRRLVFGFFAFTQCVGPIRKRWRAPSAHPAAAKCTAGNV